MHSAKLQISVLSMFKNMQQGFAYLAFWRDSRLKKMNPALK